MSKQRSQQQSFQFQGADWAFIAFTVLGVLRWLLLTAGTSWFFGFPAPHPMTNYGIALVVSGGVTAVMFYLHYQSKNEIVSWVKYVIWGYFIYVLILRAPG